MNVNINGITYDLNTDVDLIRNVINKLIKENSKDVQIRPGQQFLDKDNDMIYILARVEADKMCLINLIDGNRFNNPTKTKNLGFVTVFEWAGISEGGKFVRIK